MTETLLKYSNLEKAKTKLQSQIESYSADLEKVRILIRINIFWFCITCFFIDLFQTKKRADEASKNEKNLEREAEELKAKLNVANAELESVYQSSRTHHSELSKYKHLNEHLTEQVEIFQKEKRKTSGNLKK